MFPYRVQFEGDDMAFVVLATSEDEAFAKWVKDREAAGAIGMIASDADAQGKTLRDLTDVFALPPCTGDVFFADRV